MAKKTLELLKREEEELRELIRQKKDEQKDILRKLVAEKEKKEEWYADPNNAGESYDNTILNSLEDEYWEVDDELNKLDEKLGLVIAEIEDVENPPEKIECSNCGRIVEELDDETDVCKKCTREFEEGDPAPRVPESKETWDENKDP